MFEKGGIRVPFWLEGGWRPCWRPFFGSGARSIARCGVGGGGDKVKATGERCRGRVMTTHRRRKRVYVQSCIIVISASTQHHAQCLLLRRGLTMANRDAGVTPCFLLFPCLSPAYPPIQRLR